MGCLDLLGCLLLEAFPKSKEFLFRSCLPTLPQLVHDLLGRVPAVQVDLVSPHVEHVGVKELKEVLVELSQGGVDMRVDRVELTTWRFHTIVLHKIERTKRSFQTCQGSWLTHTASFPLPSDSPNCHPLPTWAGASNSGRTRTPLKETNSLGWGQNHLRRAYSTMSLMSSGVYTWRGLYAPCIVSWGTLLE